MSKIMPFRRSGQLIHEIDEFLDRCGEAALLLETTLLNYFEAGPDEQLQERTEQIRAIEERADELRRGITSTMYTEMLIPDTRGDVLELLDAADGGLDEMVHLLVRLDMERPEIPEEFVQNSKALMREVSAATQVVLGATRKYFKDPQAVRAEVHKVSFHDKEATNIGLRLGRDIYSSDLPLAHKMHLGGFLDALRSLGALADDIADGLVIIAVKRLD